MATQLTITNDKSALTTIKQPPDAPASFQSKVPDYALLFFDHLYSEYQTLKGDIPEAHAALFEALHAKRLKDELTWSDIYAFDLALVDERPLENLIRKAYDARAKYRSIAGQKEYDEYMASKPPDLMSILVGPDNQPAAPDQPDNALAPPPDEPAPPAPLTEPNDKRKDFIQRILRADVRYLLSKFYLYYAMLPMREGYRDHLTKRAVRMTKLILATIAVLIVISVAVGALVNNTDLKKYNTLLTFAQLLRAFGPVVGSVVFAGIVGGCVSMLQRIQSAPSEGDALFNLAALTNGWRGLSLSPLYGGIFASLLFVLFSAGMLKGSVFPEISTAKPKDEQVAEQQAPPAADAAADANNQQETAAGEEAKDTAAENKPAEEKTDENASPKANVKQVLQLNDFLRDTGPRDGVAFALLLIWSFIAGFAERLVPDTLNRLVAKNEAIQGTNS